MKKHQATRPAAQAPRTATNEGKLTLECALRAGSTPPRSDDGNPNAIR